MVEIDVSQPLPENVLIRSPYGNVLQQVDFEWVPFYCKHCKKLGHEMDNCRVLKRQTGRTANVVVEPVVTEAVVAADASPPVVPVEVVDEVPAPVVTPVVTPNAGSPPPPPPPSGQADKDDFTLVTRKRGKRILPIMNVDSNNLVRLHFMEQEVSDVDDPPPLSP
ncbi:hypothetical protein RND81_02G184100 [Saponaria officinalis]|uniref:DUF4283 domain-containing protein n=1 Tax=Saponaria officinalis TaxID=3572 RepID=A0AAW1MVU2_SAPOF